MCHVTEYRMEVGALWAHYLASEVGILLNATYKWPKRGCARLGCDLFNSNKLLLKNEKHL